MNITVTLTASPELLDVLSNIASAFTGKTVSAAPVKKETVKPPVQATTAVPATQQNSTSEEGNVSLEEVKQLVSEKSKAVGKEKIKAILTSYGVANVSTLPAENYTAFYNQVKEL